MTTVHEVIVHCQKQIKKEPPADKLLHYLRRLHRLKITIDDLRETGVGKTVNQLSRLEGDVGQFAGKIVEEWKAMVETQGSEDKEQSESSASDSDHSDLEIDMNYQPQSSPPRSNDQDVQARDEDEEDEEEDEEEEDESDHESHQQENNNRWEPSPPKKETSSYNYDRDRRKVDESSDDDDDGGEDEGSDHKSSWESTKESQLEDIKSKKSSPPAPVIPIPVVIKTEPDETERHRDRDKHGSSKDHKNHYIPERLSEKDEKGDKYRDKQKDRHSKDRDRDHRDDRQKHRQDDSRHRRHEKDKGRDHRRERDDDRHHSSRSSKHEKSRESRSHKENKDKHKTSEDKSRNKSSSESPKRKIKEEKPDKHIETLRDSSGGSSSSSHKRKKPDSTPNEDKNKSTKKLKLIESKIESQEIDSTSGLNFSDVLGCLDKTLTSSTSSKPKKLAGTSSPVKPPKKNGAVESVILQKTIKTENNSFSNKPSSSYVGDISPKSSKAKVKTETASYAPPVLTFQPPKPTNVAIDLGLEDKPFRTRYEDSLLSMGEKSTNEFEALSTMMSSRKDRTKVYSGNKTGFVGKLPTLFEMSIRVIQENLDCLGYTGGVPYDILKPALKCATVKQLEEIEFYNAYLQEYTDELWQYHCQRDCKGARPNAMETWKDLYYRCQDERQAKLNLLASKVKRNAELAQPVRKAKLAYVEPSSRGPKFNRSKAATIKNGMKTLKHREEKGPKTGGPSYSASAGGKAGSSSMTVEEAAIIIPSESRAGSAGAPSISRISSSSQSTTSTALKKPRRAPLMQKTMKLIKSIYRR